MDKIKYGYLCFIPVLVYVVFQSLIPETIVFHIGIFGSVIYINCWTFVLINSMAGFVLHCGYIWLLSKHPDWIGCRQPGKYRHLYFPILINGLIFVATYLSK